MAIALAPVAITFALFDILARRLRPGKRKSVLRRRSRGVPNGAPVIQSAPRVCGVVPIIERRKLALEDQRTVRAIADPAAG
jgi:hypothetical protein